MKRILVVEDKEENRYYLQALLSGHGWTVETACHGAEALTLARRERPDIVVSDLLMPVMDGYTLLRHWRHDTKLRDIPFIVYTATYTEAEDERLALNLGADAFILKPAEPEDFLDRLAEAEARGVRSPRSEDSAPAPDENSLLQIYSETLIRKLEEKMLELEQSNERLERDLAERREMEASLRESELRFRQLAENIREAFWLSSIDKQRIEYISPAYEAIWGRTCAELYAHPEYWIESIHPEDQARIAEAARTKQTSDQYRETYRVVRPDGSIRWIHDRAFPVTDAEGVVYRVVGMAADITDQVEAMERVREQAALLDETLNAVVVVSMEDEIELWNRSAGTVYGYAATEAMGERFLRLVRADAVQWERALAELQRVGKWSGEVRHRNKANDEVIVSSRCTLLRAADGTARSILIVNTDITERKSFEVRLLRAQRLESIGTLAGGIAHDLNNLLAPIVMGVDLLQRQPHSPHDASILHHIGNSAQRGTHLVKQVLSFARGIEGARLPICLDHLVSEIESIIQNTFPKNISLSTRIPRDLWLIVGDPTQIHQVLLNLCVNARDAMPEGGRLTLRAENVALDDQYVGMEPDLKPGPHVRFEVEDEGEGIPPHLLERVFDPFFTTKEVGKGTGLGLSTALGIIRGHGGVIQVESAVGRGTTFRILLPAQAEEGPLPREDLGDRNQQKDLPTGAECVLVVDDEEAIRLVVRHTLEAFGYEVLVAEDGAEAIALYAQHADRVALVLTDMMMPVMDGPALIRALRQIQPKVRIIGISGLAGEARRSSESGSGLKHFLVKPFSARTLLELVRKVLEAPASTEPTQA